MTITVITELYAPDLNCRLVKDLLILLFILGHIFFLFAHHLPHFRTAFVPDIF